MAKTKVTPRKPPVSRSAKAGLTFPVSRLNRHLRERGAIARVGAGAPCYLAAVLEYSAAEVLEVAGNICNRSKRKRVSKLVSPTEATHHSPPADPPAPAAQDVLAAIRGDVELNRLLAGAAFFTGSKLRNVGKAIHPASRAKVVETEVEEEEAEAEEDGDE